MGLPQGLLIQRRQQVRGFDPRSPGEARGRVCGLIALDALPPACLCVAKGERSNSSRWPSEKPTCGARVHPNMPIVSMVRSRKCKLPRSISADTEGQDREWRAGAAGSPAPGTRMRMQLFAEQLLHQHSRSIRMIGKTLTLAAAALLSTQVLAQTTQDPGNAAQGVTSGPGAGSPTTMGSPQAGPSETKHQRQVVNPQSRSVRPQGSGRATNDDGGATGSSTPSYAAPPR